MQSKPASYIVAVSILVPLSVTAVLFRVLSNIKRKQSLKVHDYLIFLAEIYLLGYIIGKVIAVAVGGLGLHYEELSFSRIVLTLKIFWIGEWLWATSVTSFRLAILLLYMQIIKTKTFNRLCWVTGTLVLAYWVACVLTICLLCRPIAYNWNRLLRGSCGDVMAIEIFSGVWNMLVDIWVVFLPLPSIWKLHMNRQRKWGVTACFALGFLTAGVNLARMITSIKCPATPDFSYCGLNSAILITAEMSGGIVVACVPTFGAIFFSKSASRSTNYPRHGPPTIGSEPIRLKKHPGKSEDSFLSTRGSWWAEDELSDALTRDAADMGVQSQFGSAQTSRIVGACEDGDEPVICSLVNVLRTC